MKTYSSALVVVMALCFPVAHAATKDAGATQRNRAAISRSIGSF
ncbi:hypothetical protein QFZ94_002056 [Paraburkholderia sp. JPY465]